jgi:ribosomal protein L11 methyltransferase
VSRSGVACRLYVAVPSNSETQVPTTSFIELSFELRDLEAEAAEEACFECGATSVTYSDMRDDPVLEPAPGEFRLWPATRLQALFPGDTNEAHAMTAVATALGFETERIATRRIEDRVWEREWLKDFHAMRFGKRLWVAPHHESVDEPGAIVVRLDPGLAFGTGTHPTTALCLEWLDANLALGATVIDYGCGSGILAIAAAKLGARHASCFDIDPQALIATRDNATANEMGARVQVYESADDLPRPVDVLVANILSGPLCELAPAFSELVRPGGALLLAGLMEHQVAEVTQAHSAWFDMRPFGKRDDWVGLSGRRRF